MLHIAPLRILSSARSLPAHARHARRLVPATALLVLAAASAASAAGPVYFSPAYDSSTGTGPSGFERPSPFTPVAARGFAVGLSDYSVSYAYLGSRGLRWDSSGSAQILPPLGADSRGYALGRAAAVNASGVAVGTADYYIPATGAFLGSRAVRWDAAGNVSELQNLGTDDFAGTASGAYSINASGSAAGFATRYVGGQAVGSRAVRWDPAGNVTELPALSTTSGGFTTAFAYHLNDANVAVGSADVYGANDSFRGFRAVRWNAAGQIQVLGDLGTDSSGSAYVSANASNVAGFAVGSASLPGPGYSLGNRAVRWNPAGDALQLPTLGTDSFNRTDANAYAINASGVTVGSSDRYSPDGAYLGVRGVRWTADATAQELPTLGDSGGYAVASPAASPAAVNDAGFIAGFSLRYVDGAFSGIAAVVWRPDNTLVDLATLAPFVAAGITPSQATGISSDGWVSGFADFDPDGAGPLSSYRRGFLFRLHPDALRLSRPSYLSLRGTASPGTLLDFPATGFEDGAISLLNTSPGLGGPVTLALDLAGTGDIAQALVDLAFVSGGNYSVVTDPSIIAPYSSTYGTTFDALVTFTDTAATNFSWDFRGLGVSVDRLTLVPTIAIVPEPAQGLLLLPALTALTRRRRPTR